MVAAGFAAQSLSLKEYEMTLKWETIELLDQLSPQNPKLGNWLKTERASVPGGWLVRTILIRREAAQVPGSGVEPEYNSSVALAFVPGSAGTW